MKQRTTVPVVLSLAVTGIIWNFMLRNQVALCSGLLGPRYFDNPISILWQLRTSMPMSFWPSHPGDISATSCFLYLSGLKSVDPALREAAALDGATEWQTFQQGRFCLQ
jgi:multiple sugar transport system permease protein/raffinose/stachyose/melibiose transport system permease protein